MTAQEFHKAVVELYDTLHPYALRLTKDAENANDLLQDTVLKALSSRDKYRHDTNLKAWMFTIMRNLFINGYRKRRKRNTVIDSTDNLFLLNSKQTTVANESLSKFVLDDINQAIDNLPEGHRVPFTMMHEGYKYQEIADALKLPLGTVKSRIFLARRQLSTQLSVYKKTA